MAGDDTFIYSCQLMSSADERFAEPDFSGGTRYVASAYNKGAIVIVRSCTDTCSA